MGIRENYIMYLLALSPTRCNTWTTRQKWCSVQHDGTEYLYDVDPITDLKKKGQPIKLGTSPSEDNITPDQENVNSRQMQIRDTGNIIEAAERSSSVRNAYMEAAANWRGNMSALNDPPEMVQRSTKSFLMIEH